MSDEGWMISISNQIQSGGERRTVEWVPTRSGRQSHSAVGWFRVVFCCMIPRFLLRKDERRSGLEVEVALLAERDVIYT